MSTAAGHDVAQGAPGGGAGERLFLSFSAASLLVLLTVLVAWVLVKRAGGEEELAVRDLSLEVLPTTALARSRGGVATLLDQADVAFAAGRIIEPRFDNALYFYRAALEQSPGDPAVQAGVERVGQWLGGQSDLALDEGEFARAAAFAAQIVELRPGDPAASARFRRTRRMSELAADARLQGEQGELAASAQSWRALLALDAENRAAREGLRTVAVGLVEAGGAAATAGRVQVARQLLAAAREADDSVPGLSALGARIESLDRASRERARSTRLAEIRTTIRSGLLLGDEGPLDAFAQIDALAAEQPDEAELGSLRADAGLALLELGRSALALEDFDRVERVLERARERGVMAAERERLTADLEHRRYLAAFARGEWTLQAISDLTVLEQVAPTYPERATRAAEGWVDLEFTVAADGSVRDPRVLDSSARAFVRPSLDALERWRFQPSSVGGRAVPVRAVLRFTFRSN
ncbi:MAG: energy transducer TonB [Pseudomonadales bacterium]|jgi:protein TonB|nr:energy transducer TonB [Pseudomonadales bacterium]